MTKTITANAKATKASTTTMTVRELAALRYRQEFERMFRKYGRGQMGVEQLKRAYLLFHLYKNDYERLQLKEAKKEAKEAANRKRAATLLAKKQHLMFFCN